MLNPTLVYFTFVPKQVSGVTELSDCVIRVKEFLNVYNNISNLSNLLKKKKKKNRWQRMSEMNKTTLTLAAELLLLFFEKQQNLI